MEHFYTLALSYVLFSFWFFLVLSARARVVAGFTLEQAYLWYLDDMQWVKFPVLEEQSFHRFMVQFLNNNYNMYCQFDAEIPSLENRPFNAEIPDNEENESFSFAQKEYPSKNANYNPKIKTFFYYYPEDNMISKVHIINTLDSLGSLFVTEYDFKMFHWLEELPIEEPVFKEQTNLSFVLSYFYNILSQIEQKLKKETSWVEVFSLDVSIPPQFMEQNHQSTDVPYPGKYKKTIKTLSFSNGHTEPPKFPLVDFSVGIKAFVQKNKPLFDTMFKTHSRIKFVEVPDSEYSMEGDV